MKRAYVDIPDGQIHYCTEGNGEPLLLLHMAGSSSDEYRRVIPFLSETFCVFAMDFMGHGGSDKPPYKYKVEDHMMTVVSFMDSLSIDKSSVVGHHSGATIGAELAINWPQRVDKLVLSSYPYLRDTGEWLKERANPNFSRVEINPDGLHLMEWWRRAKRYGDPTDIVEERALDFHKAGPRGEELHWAQFDYGPKAATRLPLIKSPTLVLSGSRDFLSAMAEDVRNLIPGSKINIIENGPVYIDRIMPKEFAESILTFLKSSGSTCPSV